MTSQKRNLVLLIFIVLIIVSAIIFAVVRKKQIDKKVTIIKEAINNEVGSQGEDIDTLLSGVNPLSTTISSSVLEDLYSAKGSSWYSFDNPSKIYSALSGKSKSYIKTLAIAFQNKYGQKLDDFIRSVFDDITGFDDAGYAKVLNIVKSAS